MRKLLTGFVALSIVIQVNAQTISNGGFEAWTSTPLWEEPVVDPSTFTSTNYDAFNQSRQINVTKVARNAGFALRMENIILTGGDREGETQGGIALWGGGLDANMVFAGGFPYSDQNVTGLVGRFNYDLAAASPGGVLLQFKKDGVPIGGDPLLGMPFYLFQFDGSTAGEFVEMTFALSSSLPVAPDSVVVAFTSFNPFDDTPSLEPGYFMEIDSLYLTSAAGNTLIPGGNLDSWMSLPDTEFADNWNLDGVWTEGINFSKTTDSYGGTYALQLTTIYSESYVEVGGAGQGRFIDDGVAAPIGTAPNVIPGVKVDGMPQEFSFAYKYTVPGTEGDTAFVAVVFTKWDEGTQQRLFAGQFDFKLVPASEYTLVSETFSEGNFAVAPDSMLITISSSFHWDQSPNTPQVGSTLIIDEIALMTGSITGNNTSLSEKVQVYPLPASSHVNILVPSEITAAVVLNSLSSPVMAAAGVGKNSLDLDISHLDPGVYFIRLETEEGALIKKVIKE